MGRGSKIKHIEKNGYSKFKQVLVQKEVKKQPQKPGTSKELQENTETSNKLDKHGSLNKPDKLEKSLLPETTNPTLTQVKIQETPETSKRLEVPKGQERSERPQIFESPNTIDEYESLKNPNRIAKPLKPEEPEVGSEVIPDTCDRSEMPKEQRKKTKRQNRSQKPIPNSPNKPDGLEKSLLPETTNPTLTQVKIQETPEILQRPEVPKGQERSETPQIFESANTIDEHESLKNPNRIEKPLKPEEPEIGSEVIPDTCDRSETPKEQRKKTKRQNRSQKPIPNSPNKPDELEKSLLPETTNPILTQVKIQETPEILQRPEVPKGQERSERPQIFESPNIIDEHESLKNPYRIAIPLKPEEPQVGCEVIPETCNRSETPKGQRKKTKRQDRSQKPIPNSLSEYDSPKKADVLEKFQKPKDSQSGSQEGLETSERPEMTKEYEISETTGRPEVKQKFKTPEDNPDGYESLKTPDELSKSQKSVGPQIESQEGGLVKGYEITKKTEKPELVKKSGNPEERPVEHDSPKNLDGLAKLQNPEEPQVKSQVMPDKTKRPETPKGQRKKTKWQQRTQKDESRNENNCPNKADREKIEKSPRFNGPQVHSQERPQTPNRPTTTNAAETTKKTKSPEPNEHERKSETLDKPLVLETPQTHEAIQKIVVLDSPQRPDKHDMPVKPERTENHESSEKLDLKKLEKIADIEKIHYEEAIKHPLEHSWGMWLITNDKRNWEDNLVKLTSFNTVEDYWCLYHHMKPPSELERGKDYAVFKNNFRPMWEDGANRNGGRWLINFDKKRSDSSDLDSIWMYVVLLVIGESFRVPDSICGAVVSIRMKNRIAVWVPNYKNDNAVRDVGNTLKNTLGLRGRLSFQQHNTVTSILTF